MPPQSLTLPIPKAPLMFVDIEAGPNQAYIWLISVLVEGKPDSLRLFYAETPASEKKILNDFLSYRKEFDGYTICHYGGFDERLTRRQITTYGLDDINLGRWFDLRPDPLLFSKPVRPTFQAGFRQAARSASHNSL